MTQLIHSCCECIGRPCTDLTSSCNYDCCPPLKHHFDYTLKRSYLNTLSWLCGWNAHCLGSRTVTWEWFSCPQWLGGHHSLFTSPLHASPSPQRVLVAPSCFNKTRCSPWGPKHCVLANTDRSINVPYQCWDCWQVPQSKRDCDPTITPHPSPRHTLSPVSSFPWVPLSGKSAFKWKLIFPTHPNTAGSLYLGSGCN